MLVFQVHGRIIEFRVPIVSYKIGRKPPICMAHFPPLASVTLVTKSTSGDSRYDLYFKTRRSAREHSRTKRRSRHAAARQKFHRHRVTMAISSDFTVRQGVAQEFVPPPPPSISLFISGLSLPLLFVLPSYVSRREKHIKKLRWLKSELRTSSILKSETKSTRLPTYLENVHRPPRFPSSPPSSHRPPLASTNHDSIFDLAKISSPAAWRDGHRHGGGEFPRTPEGGKTEQTAWTVAGARKIFAER